MFAAHQCQIQFGNYDETELTGLIKLVLILLLHVFLHVRIYMLHMYIIIIVVQTLLAVSTQFVLCI